MDKNLPKLKIDPEFRDILPPLTSQEKKDLEKKLLHEGCKYAITMWNGTILDGHNRYYFCHKHGIPFETDEMNFNDRDEAKLWIFKNQIARRNLKKFQRVVLALKFKDQLSERAKENQKLSQGRGKKGTTNKSNLNTRKTLADMAGVGEGTIQKCETIIEYENQKIISNVERGELSIDAAFKRIKSYTEPLKPKDNVVKKNLSAEMVKEIKHFLKEKFGDFDAIKLFAKKDEGKWTIDGRCEYKTDRTKKQDILTFISKYLFCGQQYRNDSIFQIINNQLILRNSSTEKDLYMDVRLSGFEDLNDHRIYILDTNVGRQILSEKI